jgi:hypothetical protein
MFFSTPRYKKEENINLNNESMNDLCSDKQRKVGDFITIDAMIDLVR